MIEYQVVVGDITKIKVDAIVNCANTTLLGGGGVDGAIHRAAGPKLLEECKKLEGCNVGFSKTTKGYDLPAKYVIHAVGPNYMDYDEDEAERLLHSTYESVLNEAINHEGIKTLSIPAISCGVYAFPLKKAVKIAIRTIFDFQGNPINNPEGGVHFIDKWLDKIIFVVSSEEIKQVYEEELKNIEEENKSWKIFMDNLKGLNSKRKDLVQILQKYPHFATRFDDIAIKTVVNNKTKYNTEYVKLLLKYGADSDICIVEFPCGKVKSLYDMVQCIDDKHSQKMLKFLIKIGCKPKNDVFLEVPLEFPNEIPAFLRTTKTKKKSTWYYYIKKLCETFFTRNKEDKSQ